jgi:hypothetical protein
MATGAVARQRELVREVLYMWEGRDKAGRVVRGEMRAGGESVVAASLRRRGILATGAGFPPRIWRCSRASCRRCCGPACR